MTTLYGQEILRDSDENGVSFIEEGDSLDIQQLTYTINQVEDNLNTALEAYKTLVDIHALYPSLESISEREKTLIQMSVDKATNSLGMESVAYKPDTFTKTIDTIYLAIVSVFDILFELIGRFIRWFKEMFVTNSKTSEKISASIRQIINKSPKQTFEIVFKEKEKNLFTINGKFDIIETLSLFTSLLTLYVSNKTNGENVVNAIRVKPFEKSIIKINLDTVFPILERKPAGRNGLTTYIGPHLPKDYQLQAILPDNLTLDGISTEEAVNLLNLSDISIVKVKETPKDNKAITLSLSKQELEDINKSQIAFNRHCITILNYLDWVYTSTGRLRRHYRNMNYQNTSNLNPEVVSFMTTNLAIVSFISRTVREPLLSLNQMAQTTNKFLLNKLTDFAKKENKDH